ncbi:MAG: hypothetical protein WCB04_02045 [Mycobacteriales bacterium]
METHILPARGASLRTTRSAAVIALMALTGALLVLGFALQRTPADAATQSIAQCNNRLAGPMGATTGLDCDVTIVNTISGGVTSSTTTLIRTCTLDPCAGGNGTFVTNSTSLVTSVSQCNGSSNDAAHPITCHVRITNNISADTPNSAPVSAATVNQCNGSAGGGGQYGANAPLVCDPFPATTTGATVTQCNGSVTGGGSTAVCSVGTASTISPAIPISVNQCNGTGNAGGTLLTCDVTITSNITAAVTPTPTPTGTSGGAGTGTGTGTGTSTGSGTGTSNGSGSGLGLSGPQVPNVPVGGVSTGGGSTSHSGNGLLMGFGITLLLAAAASVMLRRRVAPRIKR